MKRFKSNSGFLLLEVLFCMVIVTAGILVIFQSFRRSVYAMTVSEDYFLASLALERKSIEIEDEVTFPEGTAVFDDRIASEFKIDSAVSSDEVKWTGITLVWERREKESSLETWIISPESAE